MPQVHLIHFNLEVPLFFSHSLSFSFVETLKTVDISQSRTKSTYKAPDLN